MNALFVLALVASPSRAGVVVSVKHAVAPASPSAPVVPVLPPGGGSLIAPMFEAGLDLRGLPRLTAPAPGLSVSPVQFAGDSPEAAAVRVEPGSAQTLPALAKARPGPLGKDQTPLMPGKAVSGAAVPAIELDHQSGASTLENGVTLSRDASRGRAFFDQSADNGRGALGDEIAAGRLRADAAVAIDSTGRDFGGAARVAAPNAVVAFGAGHGPSSHALFEAAEGETLRDAVASAPGAAAHGGVISPFLLSASPNGDVAASGARGQPLRPFSGAPRPLALDLSGSGLIVRVRAALGGATLAPGRFAPSAFNRAAARPYTALLERGAMFEAFSVAGDYAARRAVESAAAEPGMAVGARVAPPTAPRAPISGPAQAPLWWAWLVLPLIAASIRSFP